MLLLFIVKCLLINSRQGDTHSLQAFALYGYHCLPLLSCASDNEQGMPLPSLVSAVGVAIAVLDVGIAKADERGRTADVCRQLVVGDEVHGAVSIC